NAEIRPLAEHGDGQRCANGCGAKNFREQLHPVIMAAEEGLSRYDAPMKYRPLALTAAAVALLGAVSVVPVGAHHSFAAEYDSSKSIKVTGEVVRLEWTNPHARVVVDGKD